MSEISSPTPPTSKSDLHDEIRGLRIAMELMLVAGLIASLSVSLYIFKQVKQLRREVDGRRETVAKIPEETRKMTAFISQVKEFGRTYPDFAEILRKYNLKDDGTAPAAAPPPKN